MATFRTEFKAQVSAALLAAVPPFSWVVSESEEPDASVSYVVIEYPGGREEAYSMGSPGANAFLEEGQVTLRVASPLGKERDEQERCVRVLRNWFRGRTFAVNSDRCRIEALAMLGGGFMDGGTWAEALGVSYRKVSGL